VTARPAVKFLLPLAAGIAISRLAGFSPGPWLIVSALLFLAAVVLAVMGKNTGALTGILYPALICSFGILLLAVDLHVAGPGDLSGEMPADTVSVAGTIAEARGRSVKSARFLMDCSSIRDTGGIRPAGGRLLLTVSGAALKEGLPAALLPGREVVVRGVIRPPRSARNPGEPDWAAYYQLAGIDGEIGVRTPAHLFAGPMSVEGFVNAFVLPVRRTLSEHLRSHVREREARFLNGLILGERNEVPSDLKADFVTVGVMHLLAISGQQVVIVALLIAALLTILRIPETPRFFLVAVCLAYYVLLTGASPSVTRAGIMSIVLLGSRVAQRKADIFNALGIAAVVILLASPRQLFDPGFLLSFAAVLSIVLLYPAIIGALPRFSAWCARIRLLDVAWKGIAVSLAAGIGTAPIVAFFFGRVSVVGFLANILIVPLSSLALVLGMLTVAASFLSGWVASVYAAGAEATAWLTFRLVEFFADFPFASVSFRISLFAVGVFYAFSLFLLRSLAEKSWKPVLLGGLVLANIVLYAWVIGERRDDAFRMTFLDVGQGDAAFLEFPGGKTMLIDAGPATPGWDAGERIVLPFLGRKGIRRIDYLVVSHPHSDHLGGVPAVLRAMEVGRVIDGGSVAGSALYREYRKLIDSLRIPYRPVGAGDRFGEDLPVGAYVLWPDTLSGSRRANLNEQSVVIEFRYGTTSALFTGDAEKGAEAIISDRYGDFLDADILKAGHHGSSTSSTPGFVSKVTPEVAVISVGEGNLYGHPSRAVVGRYEEMGSRVERTDLGGAVIFESDGSRWDRVAW